jgi:hypothetical protein
MSENYRFYAAQVQKNRIAARASTPVLREELTQLLLVVRRCEAIWAVEDRIERGLGSGRRVEPKRKFQT